MLHQETEWLPSLAGVEGGEGRLQWVGGERCRSPRRTGRRAPAKEEREGTPEGRSYLPQSPNIVEVEPSRGRRGCGLVDRKTRDVRGGAPLIRHPMAGKRIERRGNTEQQLSGGEAALRGTLRR